jgi:adenylylsulfate reductase subunit A
MKVQQLGIFIETDVLIIGGGIAGLFAAIKAKDEDPLTEVLLVDKCYPGASGSSVFAAGVIPNWQPGDDFDSYVKEIIVDNAEYMIDQDYVEVAVRESYDRVRDLIEYGVEFQQNEKGEILRIPALSSSFQNCTAFKGGLQWMWKLRAQATKRQVEMLERIFVADLLMDNGRCVGAVGFHLRTGEFYVFKAKSTILANGSAIYARPQLGPSGTTGDAQAMALRAGLQLRSMEQVFATIGPAGISSPGLHAIFGNGGILVNRKGERVMEKYNPGLMERARRFEMARAILQEWRESKGPCYVDCTHLPKENIERIKTSLPFFIAGLNILGLDLTRDKIEWVPYSLSLQHNGGIRINNADGDVNVPGLWAVGTAGDYCGGVDTTAAAALPGSAVQGARASLQEQLIWNKCTP